MSASSHFTVPASSPVEQSNSNLTEATDLEPECDEKSGVPYGITLKNTGQLLRSDLNPNAKIFIPKRQSTKITCPLMQLIPEEIQLMIWRYACTSTSRVKVLDENYCGKGSSPYINGFYGRLYERYIALGEDKPPKDGDIAHGMQGTLRLVNRHINSQLSHEAGGKANHNEMFFASNAFTLSDTDSLNIWVEKLHEDQLLAIKDLEIHMYRLRLFDEKFLNSLSKLKRLQHLTLIDTMYHNPYDDSFPPCHPLHKGCAEMLFHKWTQTNPHQGLLALRGLKSFLLKQCDLFPFEWSPKHPSYTLPTTTMILDKKTNNLRAEETTYEVSREELLSMVAEEYREVSKKMKEIVTQPVVTESTAALSSKSEGTGLAE